MIPILIEDLIKKLTDKNHHIEKRQFYYISLINIKNAIEKAIQDYEKEKYFK
jgi:hypothetical protein